MATLAIAVKDCYQVAPDVYALYQWGYARVTDALDMPEVR
jgi:hypothetical protein